jgi:hypothetical protein
VQFFAGALDAEGAPLTYAWDFADPQSPDNTSTLANPFHTYWSMGTYIAWVTVSDGVNEVSDSVVIVVDSRPPLLTTSAMVDLSTDAHKFKGTVTYAAFVDLTPPSSHDIISLEFDGNRIFTAPFSAFSPGLYPDTYVLVKRRLLVQIDLAENLLFVDAGRANLVKFDNTNGVDVVLSWGDEVGVDQFVMTQLNPIIWSYNR